MKQIKILVVGDFIRDRYRICRLKGNLCQEMPLCGSAKRGVEGLCYMAVIERQGRPPSQ